MLGPPRACGIDGLIGAGWWCRSVLPLEDTGACVEKNKGAESENNLRKYVVISRCIGV